MKLLSLTLILNFVNAAPVLQKGHSVRRSFDCCVERDQLFDLGHTAVFVCPCGPLTYRLFQQCFSKGDRTDDGLVRMCTSCVVTTDLGVNHWPRYFTEITCHGLDNTCLNLHNDAHEVSPPPIMPSQGRCTESRIHMTFYRYDNFTTVGATNTRKGQWNAYTQEIRGGCVCGFDKRSWILHKFFYESQLHPSS